MLAANSSPPIRNEEEHNAGWKEQMSANRQLQRSAISYLLWPGICVMVHFQEVCRWAPILSSGWLISVDFSSQRSLISRAERTFWLVSLFVSTSYTIPTCVDFLSRRKFDWFAFISCSWIRRSLIGWYVCFFNFKYANKTKFDWFLLNVCFQCSVSFVCYLKLIIRRSCFREQISVNSQSK